MKGQVRLMGLLLHRESLRGTCHPVRFAFGEEGKRPKPGDPRKGELCRGWWEELFCALPGVECPALEEREVVRVGTRQKSEP